MRLAAITASEMYCAGGGCRVGNGAESSLTLFLWRLCPLQGEGKLEGKWLAYIQYPGEEGERDLGIYDSKEVRTPFHILVLPRVVARMTGVLL